MVGGRVGGWVDWMTYRNKAMAFRKSSPVSGSFCRSLKKINHNKSTHEIYIKIQKCMTQCVFFFFFFYLVYLRFNQLVHLLVKFSRSKKEYKHQISNSFLFRWHPTEYIDSFTDVLCLSPICTFHQRLFVLLLQGHPFLWQGSWGWLRWGQDLTD